MKEDTLKETASKGGKADSGHKLKVVKVLRTCVHDGAGLRTTIFFRGCALKCKWCQNPEALAFEPRCDIDIDLSAEQLVETVLRDKKYYFSSGGGVTFSGGEPFLQDANALERLARELKASDINITVETTLNAPWDTIERLLPYIDLFYVDFKVLGDEALHKSLTGQDSTQIADNLKKLLLSSANVKYRMVMVPKMNDGEGCISAAAEFLKGIDCTEIELLKYHNMYEDKAKKFGISVPLLGISAEDADKSLRKGLAKFRELGIAAYNVDVDAKPQKTEFPKSVMDIQQAQRDAGRALCIEASKLKTRFYRKNGFKQPVALHRAKRLKYVLKNKTVKVYPNELLVGNFTAKRVGGQVWEEQYGVLDISFLYKVNRQTPVSFKISRKDRWYFYTRVFPFWFRKSVFGRVNAHMSDLVAMLGRSSEMLAGFQNNMAAIAHFVPNYDRILELGTEGLIEEIKAAARENPQNNQDFYEGAIISLNALADWADRYADEIEALSAKIDASSASSADIARKAELSEMAKICKSVPRHPARSFHEALQSIVFIQIAICQEAYENAVSFGRLDQILYPYYAADVKSGRITYERARELLMMFVLKMDEAILVNDGDSLLNIAKLFETLSTDQALTFGGCDRNGNDATNDVTYMIIDACELQPLAINMCARINKNSPKKYLDRLAEIYINGCPMPELFSDEEYIKAIPLRHDTTIEDARDYPIVGCVEPLASKDHFGNTDSANMNVCLPLLQAMKGQTYDLWNCSAKISLRNVYSRIIEYAYGNNGKCPYSRCRVNHRNRKLEKYSVKQGRFVYNPPKSMDELLTRMQTSLNKLACEILTDQQKIEWELAKYFTTPLASSLFKGCVKRGKDLYEGGADYNTSGIQAVGIVDVADSLYAIDSLVFKTGKYTMLEMIEAIDCNFDAEKNKAMHKRSKNAAMCAEKIDALYCDIMKLPKFGDDSSREPSLWVSKVMEIYNIALAKVPYTGPRRASYTAGYYALNVSDRYGLKLQALPSGRKKGVPLANSITNHYGMEQSDLLSSLNAVGDVDYAHFAPNGTTVTFHIDSALFPGESGINNLSAIFQTFLTTGGMQFQPNVISRDLLLDAYNHPEKYKYLMVRVAGYCSYFNELSDDLKKVIINRTCYA